MEKVNEQAILEKLSDVKALLAVNTAETQNIKSNLTEIRADVREIKNDAVTRREFVDAIFNVEKLIEEKISPMRKFVYSIVGFIGLAFLGAVTQMVLR